MFYYIGTSWLQALVTLVFASPDELESYTQLVRINSFLEFKNEFLDAFPIVQNATRPRQIRTHLPFEFLPLGIRGSNPPKVAIFTFVLVV